MQIILADAKIMNENVKGINVPFTFTSTPLFQNEATAIAGEMAKYSIHDIASFFPLQYGYYPTS